MTQKMTVIDKDAREMDTTPPRTALRKIEHVRDELARVYRHARTGKIKTSEATRLTYILVSLARIIETNDLEKRIELLELENEKFRNTNQNSGAYDPNANFL